MREGPICPCPECREGDIIQLDAGLYTCTSCGKTWSLKELYEALWLDRLQKLMERKLRMQSRRPHVSEELEELDQRIAALHYTIRELAKEVAFLEKQLATRDCSPHAPSLDTLRAELHNNRKNLAMYHERLDQMMMLRDTLEESADS